MTNTCEVCKIEFDTIKRAKTCSPKCRVTLARLRVTKDPNVTLTSPLVTHAVTFRFRTAYKPNAAGEVDEDTQHDREKIREAKYWYDVPLAALPVIEKDWPTMPDYMNGRQYFLWWKNEFETDENETPVLLNPQCF